MSFIDEFAALQKSAPRIAIINTNSENSAYTNYSTFNKNCYLSSGTHYCELVFNSHDCLGCIARNHAEYEILNKKYPKEEYFKRFEEIKKELQNQNMWGKMWIPTTYPYEDTSAALYYPK